MKNISKLSKHTFAILLLVIIAGINVPYVAGSTQFTVEGYNLIPHEGWTTGNVKGYCEDDFVPIRLNYQFKNEPITILVFRVGGDYYDEAEDAYGFDYFSGFTISGDYLSATIDYVGSPDSPYNFPWSGGPGTGEMIDLPGDRGLTVRYIIEVQTPSAESVQKEFTIEFFAHESLTEFSGTSIVKRGSYYWGSTNLLVGKDPSDAGQNTIPVKKCDEEPQPSTTTTTTSSTTTLDTTSSITTITTTSSSTTASTTTAKIDTTSIGSTTSMTECSTVTETETETITSTETATATSTETITGSATTTETIITTITETATECSECPDSYCIDLGTTGLSLFGTIKCEGTNVYIGGTNDPDRSRKPSGTDFADDIDATAATLLWGMCSDGALYWDIDNTAVSQTDGHTLVAGHEVMSGGPIVNGPVRYYETQKLAPVYFAQVSGKANFFSTQGTPETGDDIQIIDAQRTWSEIGLHRDVFVIELFQRSGTEADPEYVVLSYGYGGLGTLAASIYFKEVIEPELSNYTEAYYIFQWDDTNDNSHPDTPGTDTYTLITSGT